MAADPSIFSSYLQPVRSVADYSNEMDKRDMNALQLVAQRRSNEIADLTAQQTREQIGQNTAKRNALQAIYSHPDAVDPVKRENLLLSNPLTMAEGQAAQKARIDAAHVQAQTSNQTSLAGKNSAEQQALEYKSRIDGANKALDVLASFQSPAQAMADLRANATSGELTQQQITEISRQLMGISTPEQWESWKAATLGRVYGGKWRAEQEWKTKEFALKAGNELIGPDGRVNQPLVGAKRQIAAAGATQAPGMTYMTDAQGNIVGLPTKAPLGKTVVANVVTDANRAPLPGKDGGLNDSQSKALLFGTRMQESDKILSDLAKQGVNRPSTVKAAADSVPLIGGALGALANTQQSPNQQMVEQAQRDFVNAVLRRESGAAISPSEFDSAGKQYFPSIGDSQQVIAQKAQNRKLAISGLLAEVPQQKRRSITPGAANPMPATGAAKVINFGDLQ